MSGHTQLFSDEINATMASSPQVYSTFRRCLPSLYRLIFSSATADSHAQQCTVSTLDGAPRSSAFSATTSRTNKSGRFLLSLIMMFTLFVLAHAMPSSAFAEEFPENPQPKKTTYRDCTGWVWRQHCRDITVAEPLVERPKSNATIDTPFVIFHSISFAAAFADGFVSHRYIKPQNGCYEVNPFLGKYPSAAKTYGMTLGTWGLVTTMDYFIKKSRHDGWEVPAMAETLVHGIGIGMTYNSCHI